MYARIGGSHRVIYYGTDQLFRIKLRRNIHSIGIDEIKYGLLVFNGFYFI